MSTTLAPIPTAQPLPGAGPRWRSRRAVVAAGLGSPQDPLDELDFSEYETSSGGTWRLAGVTDYVTEYEHG